MNRSMACLASVFALGGMLGWNPAAADPPKPADLGAASLPNLRDAGGYKTRDGLFVRTGLLYRSGQLVKVRPADRDKLNALGLKAVYDLRTAAERKGAPDEPPEGAKEVWLDVLADSEEDMAGRVNKLLKDPKRATAELGGGRLEAMFATLYRELVALPSARKGLGRVFADLAEGDGLPAVVHCSSGRDRTGWAAAALLTLLGVPEEVVMEDFLRSNDLLLPAYKKPIEAFAKAGGDPAVLTAVVSVKAEYLRAALAEVRAKYGSIEGYFAEGLGIDAAGQKALKDRFLTRG
ncbi:MAG: tyrosine-protein phosphatase [Gemmataceae bacterium]|nr:tyrosine-protein phosphatase [Gemmataceae bacterium]